MWVQKFDAIAAHHEQRRSEVGVPLALGQTDEPAWPDNENEEENGTIESRITPGSPSRECDCHATINLAIFSVMKKRC